MADFNPNQRIAPAFGDIYVPTTAYTDKLLANLEAKKQKEQAANDEALRAIDDSFAKSLVGVRDADIPELTKRYAAYKQLAKNNIKKKEVSPEESMAELKAQADVMDIAAKSKARKEREKALYVSVSKNPNKHIYGAATELNKIMATPVDDEDIETRLANKAVITDFSKDAKEALGTKRVVSKMPITDANGLTKVITISRYNSPVQIYDALNQKIVGSQKEHDYEAVYDQLTPQQKADVEAKFNAITDDPNKAKALGVEVNFRFPDDSQLTPKERHSKYLAMKSAIDIPPTIEETKPDYSAQTKYEQKLEAEKRKFAQQDKLAASRFAHAEYMKSIGKEADANIDLNKIVDDMEQSASPSTNVPNRVRLEFVPPFVKQGLGNPDVVYKDTKTGNYLVYNYKKDPNTLEVQKGNDGNPIIANEVQLTPDQFIISIGGSKRLVGTGKQKQSAVAEALTGQKPKGTTTTVTSKRESVSIKGNVR